MQTCGGIDDPLGGRLHGLGPCPRSIKFECCAQFAVSRTRIQLRPLEFYQKSLWYLGNHQLSPTPFANRRYVIGDVWALMWSMVFGESANYVPKPDCTVFRCPHANSS